MFPVPEYWFKTVFNLLVRDGDLSLVGDYLIVGLGGSSKRTIKYANSFKRIFYALRKPRRESMKIEGLRGESGADLTEGLQSAFRRRF